MKKKRIVKRKKKLDYYKEIINLRSIAKDMVYLRNQRMYHHKLYKQLEREVKAKEKELLYFLTKE